MESHLSAVGPVRPPALTQDRHAPPSGAKGPAATIGNGGAKILQLGAQDRSVRQLLLDFAASHHAVACAPD